MIAEIAVYFNLRNTHNLELQDRKFCGYGRQKKTGEIPTTKTMKSLGLKDPLWMDAVHPTLSFKFMDRFTIYFYK